MAEPYWVVLRELLADRGWAGRGRSGAAELWRAITRSGHDISQEQVRNLIAGSQRGQRGRTAAQYTPSPETFELLADSLAVSPSVFGEYRLALARRALDERAAGLGEALGALEAIEESLVEAVDQETAEALRAAQNGSRPEPSAHQSPTSPRGRRQGRA